MKKICLALVFFSSLGLLYWYLTAPRKSEPVYLSPKTELLQEKPDSTHEVYGYIEEINKRNRRIDSLFVEKMKIKVWQQIGFVVNGQLAMRKEKMFRLKVWTNFGLEMDIGSNNQVFWFWSKNMENPALYYAKHEDLDKTLLKTPLNPTWLMESLNISDINTENIEVARYKNLWAIFQPRNSALGEKVTVVTLIDPQQVTVVGRYLYNEDGRLVASSEIKEFTTNTEYNVLIPQKLFIIWYDENVTMEWDLSNPQINLNLKDRWQMPSFRYKIDMGQN